MTMSLAAAACVFITSYYIIIISGGAKVGIGRAQAQPILSSAQPTLIYSNRTVTQ